MIQLWVQSMWRSETSSLNPLCRVSLKPTWVYVSTTESWYNSHVFIYWLNREWAGERKSWKAKVSRGQSRCWTKQNGSSGEVRRSLSKWTSSQRTRAIQPADLGSTKRFVSRVLGWCIGKLTYTVSNRILERYTAKIEHGTPNTYAKIIWSWKAV